MISATAYDAIAEWYDATIRAGGLLHVVVLSTLYELLGAVVGRRICDLACGQGLVARHLTEHGASVIAVDISRELLKIAQRYPDNRARPIGYVQGDAQALPLQAASFDGIVCNMALMDIPDLALTLRSVARILRPEGWFVFSITYPCLEISRSQPRWMADCPGMCPVTSYFIEGPWRSDNPEGVRGLVTVYHRTLSTYLITLRKTGLSTESLREPQVPASLTDSDPRRRDFPTVLVIQCKKLMAG